MVKEYSISSMNKVSAIEIKLNIILGLALTILGLIAGLYLTLFNVMSRLPK